jgi:hypothetical protein
MAPLEVSMHYSPPKEKSLDAVNARLSAQYRLYTVAGRIRSSTIRVMPWVAPPTPAAVCAEVHIRQQYDLFPIQQTGISRPTTTSLSAVNVQ